MRPVLMAMHALLPSGCMQSHEEFSQNLFTTTQQSHQVMDAGYFVTQVEDFGQFGQGYPRSFMEQLLAVGGTCRLLPQSGALPAKPCFHCLKMV